MADDSSYNDGPPWAFIAWPTLMTVLVTVVSFVVSMTQLKTSRPPVLSTYSRPDSAEDIQAVYARLWDDPLAIYYAHDSSQTAPGADLTEVADYRFDSIVRVQATKSTRPVLLMPVLLPGGPYGEDAEERIRTRYAIQAGLANEGFELALGDRMSLPFASAAGLTLVQQLLAAS